MVMGSPTRMVPEAIWPAKPRKSLVGTDDALDGEAEGSRLLGDGDRNSFEKLEQGGAGVPGRVLGRTSYVVSGEGADRDEDETCVASANGVAEIDAAEELLEVGDDAVEDILARSRRDPFC